MSTKVATIDFHVTIECSQSCPYCWGPQEAVYREEAHQVDTATAQHIIDHITRFHIRRLVFTGGDPLQRDDIGPLIQYAHQSGLEVALSTTGDKLTPSFLAEYAPYIDLISLPLDGPTETINARTKEKGHFKAIMQALDWLGAHPQIDVKLCTPVTRHNLQHIPAIVNLAEAYAHTTSARVFYNIFQAFPRTMLDTEWEPLLVTDAEFSHLGQQLAGRQAIRINLLNHATLDQLYVMIFPDGRLVVPSGPDYLTYGAFLEIDDLDALLTTSRFDAPKHLHHTQGWQKINTA